MQGEAQEQSVEHTRRSVYNSVSTELGIQTRPLTFDIHTATPPVIEPLTVMQRVDEVRTLQRMLSDAQTSAVMLIGNPGAGKSTLAALLYNRLLLSKQQELPAPHHLVWLGVGTYTTLPDLLAAILSDLNMCDPSFFLLNPQQQIAALLQVLRRPQENTLIVLDQFESLLHPEVMQGVAGRGALALFLQMLQTDLGASRILLTGYSSPYNEEMEETRVRSCLVSQVSIPEGTALLQRRGLQGSPEELSLVWQRCAGHVFSLTLFCALVSLSKISLSYLLNSSDYQPLWSGNVTAQLVVRVYYYLNPLQYMLIRALGLFNNPVHLKGILIIATGDNAEYLYTDFEREMNALITLSLIQTAPNADGVRCYILHPLLRQHVLENYLVDKRRSKQLASIQINVKPHSSVNNPEELQAALTSDHVRVAEYYLHIARETCPPSEKRASLQDVQPLVYAIRHLCLGGCWQRACDLLFEERLHESMVHWGAWNTLIGLYTGLLPPFGILVRRDEALVYNHVGMLYGRIGEYQQSQSYFEQALALQRQLSDSQGEATTLTNQGEIYRMRGEQKLAHVHFEQALALNEEHKDPLLRCILLHNLGLLYQSEKDYPRALASYQESLCIAHTLQDQHYKGMILTNLGILLYEQGEQLEGLALLLAAKLLRQVLRDPTTSLLETFLRALEQRMGSETYTHLCQSALAIQEQVFSRFVPLDDSLQ